MRIIVLSLCLVLLTIQSALSFTPDSAYLADREALDDLQRDAFRYIWEDADPDSGMACEGDLFWEVHPVAVGGTGFGIAAIVAAVDRGWIAREQALSRLMRIVVFLRDKTPRESLHGAFPHWLNGKTGEIISFGKQDKGADMMETALLMQGLLIARAYFNGPGVEEDLRGIISGLWEDVDWNFFTAGLENGIHWHWSPEFDFRMGLRILGFNECLITYVLAISSPTHPISRKSYNYWTSGNGYKPKTVFGYTVEAALPGAGPLFLTHYSFIGLDPRRMTDAFVPGGYFVRNVRHVLSNRGYCLQNAPAQNRYGEDFWGLTAGKVRDGYAASDPGNDTGFISPTGALSSMPYTPHYAMQVLQNLRGKLKKRAWGKNGPYDALSLKDGWFSENYLAIDQLPIVCMVENYRSGLLWNLMMSDPDVQAGLQRAGIREPSFETGFPEAVITLDKQGKKYVPDACDIRRHPDTGRYHVPYWCAEAGQASFTFTDEEGRELLTLQENAVRGRNQLRFEQFMAPDGERLILKLAVDGEEKAALPVRLH